MNHNKIKLHLCRLMLCAYIINLTPVYAIDSAPLDQQFTNLENTQDYDVNITVGNDELESDSTPNDVLSENDVETIVNEPNNTNNTDTDNVITESILDTKPATSESNIDTSPINTEVESNNYNTKSVVKNFVSYIDGPSKLYLNDSVDNVTSDTWNHTETKILHIEANVEDLDPDNKYLKVSLPIGMKLHTDPSMIVDGKIISSVDKSNFSKNTIVTSNSAKYTPNCGELIFKINKDATFISIDLSVSVDNKFWSTKNGALAHDINDNAIEVSVYDNTYESTKKLDKVYIDGNNWSPAYYTDSISSYINDTQIKMTQKMTVDNIHKLYSRIYNKVYTSIDIPHCTIEENGVEVIKYAAINNVYVKNGTYKIENNKIFIEWDNIQNDVFNFDITLTFNSSDFPGNNKVTYNLGEVYVDDYFSGEAIKIKDSTTQSFTLNSKYDEKITYSNYHQEVYSDTRVGNTDMYQFLGGFKISNVGGESKKKGLLIEFPYGVDSDIGISSIRLPTLKEAGKYNISYSLWDRKTNEIFDGIIEVDKPASSSYYTGYVFNTEVAGKNIALKIPNFNSRELYFKSIEYEIGKLPGDYSANNGPYPNHSGNFHGKVLSFNPAKTQFKTTYKLLTYDENNIITNEETNQITTTIKDSAQSTCGITSFGYYDEAGSATSNILAGDNVILKGTAEGSNYPYFNTQFLSTPTMYLRLPKGISIDNSKTEFYWNKQNGTEKLSWNIVNPRILSDGSTVYTIEFNNTDFGVGFCDKNISYLGKLTYNICLKTSRSIKSLTLNAKDLLYFGDKYIKTAGSGSWGGFFVIDTFDVNGNGSTSDKIATSKDDSYLTITSNSNWLETDVTIAVNDSAFSIYPVEITDTNDTVKLKFEINNNNEGTVLKDNFYYYLPIPKKNINYNENIKDKDEVFELSFNLSKFITSPNGYDILYSSDNINFFPKDQFKNLEDITMIKIVATKDILAGATASFIIEMKPQPDTEFVNGYDTIWSPYGYQRYDKNGNSTSFIHVLDRLTVTAKEVIEDNWLNREVARQVFGDENRFADLTDTDYATITEIDLDGTSLNSPIPKDIGKLSNLTRLSLYKCNLQGEIPSEIYNLDKLINLSLSTNNLVGTISPKISNLKNITFLDLNNNNFTGNIITEIGSLTTLKKLRMADNNFTGTIPESIYNLTNLEELNLSNNSLNGKIPESIYNLTNLKELNLSNNSLNGKISPSISNLQKLKVLKLFKNQLSGELPSSFYSLKNLEECNLWKNNITGTISNKIEELSSIKFFSLSNNNITGFIPEEITNVSTLEFLDFNKNNLLGNIPDSIGNLTNLTDLRLQGNNLSGSIPHSINNLSKLLNLELMDNQFIELPSNFPDKFKTEDVLKANLIEGMPNQKEIVIKNPSKKTIEIGSRLVLPKLYRDDVEVRWNGNVEELSSAYTLESILLDKSLFDNSLIATTEGTTEIKTKIVQADISNTSAQSSNSFDVEVIKKHIPLNVTSKLSTKDWTNKDVVVTINTTSSDSIDYIECSDGTKISSQATADFTISKNGTYTFKVVTVTGESKTIHVDITNIDKDAPTIMLSQKANSNQTFTITATATDSGSGIKAIILPDGTYVSKGTATYTAPWDGSYEFTVIDNAGNTAKKSISVSGIVLDDLWLAKEVARQVKKDYKDLTQEDFDKITSITLSNKGITGKLPSYIGNLTNLQTLKLNGNDIRGSIPSEIGNLENLKVLWLADNRLTGQIPSSIGNLVSLTSLDLGLNFLDGSIPASLGQLENIQYIFLCENKLTGRIPEELGNLTTLRELCIDFNQLIGKIPNSVKNLKAVKNFEYNFVEDSSSQNTMTIRPDTTINLALDDNINVDNLRYLINIENGFGTDIGLNKAYNLAFVPDDPSFFKNGKAIKSGTTSGKIKIAEGEDSNDSAITKNSITVNIIASGNNITADTTKPNIKYSTSNSNWTNNDIEVSITAYDDVAIKEIILPDGTITSNDSVTYTVTKNGDYTFTAIDTSNNDTTITVPITNIDKELPSLTVNYNKDIEVQSLSLDIIGSDNLSGIYKITLPDNSEVNADSAKFTITSNGDYSISITDNAGNTFSTTVTISNIIDNTTPPNTTLPDECEEDKEELPPINPPTKPDEEEDEDEDINNEDIVSPVIKPDSPYEDINSSSNLESSQYETSQQITLSHTVKPEQIYSDETIPNSIETDAIANPETSSDLDHTNVSADEQPSIGNKHPNKPLPIGITISSITSTIIGILYLRFRRGRNL